ncbi:26S proteasome non-ATPase regulatory subunit 14 [Perkinsus olseni]|uniref:26S proteasome non-ATPase regulatory subunit 14 n=2 Tax=Perkinsus olseni TaxID=32597 RepID=A0A7J6N6K1_PEROL|nr:26S proteasome non-ATPase regulatory subunit 14 [Perkinsus olseni]
MMNLQQQLQNLAGGGGAAMGREDQTLPDTSEQVFVSSLALLKMLKHGRAGVPMEVMGLLLGEFIDDYTVKVVDVFSMPQSGNTVSVESIDEVFQATMLEMLNQTGRSENVVGWYHSHPGFGCWFSGTDINTQQAFEQLNPRAVGIVVDPIQSVKGKVVIDCFRLINPQMLMLGQEPRQTTSNIGHLNRPSLSALIHGLNRHYYSIAISYKKNPLEQRMLLNLHKEKWQDGLRLRSYSDHDKRNSELMSNILKMTKGYNDLIRDETKLTEEEIVVKNAGKVDPKKGLERNVEETLENNILQIMGSMLDSALSSVVGSMFSPNSGVKVLDHTPSKGPAMDSPSMISLPAHSPPVEQTSGDQADRSTAVPENAAIPSVLFHNAAFSYHFYAAHCARDDEDTNDVTAAEDTNVSVCPRPQLIERWKNTLLNLTEVDNEDMDFLSFWRAIDRAGDIEDTSGDVILDGEGTGVS